MTNTKGALKMIEEAILVVFDKALKDSEPDYEQLEQALVLIKEMREELSEYRPTPCASELALHKGDAEFLVDFNIFENKYQLKSVDVEYFKRYKAIAALVQKWLSDDA